MSLDGGRKPEYSGKPMQKPRNHGNSTTKLNQDPTYLNKTTADERSGLRCENVDADGGMNVSLDNSTLSLPPSTADYRCHMACGGAPGTLLTPVSATLRS
ncbi:unnamed protein product [Pleuronectes platessa]|uniref:Uncharacterized protein n=1 Tax=Pleuronectes platessa TaxID=8262 RepID=A0A9N7VF68_PLEPL|nr:unnamed protein product [Pleuronectes platessa]